MTASVAVAENMPSRAIITALRHASSGLWYYAGVCATKKRSMAGWLPSSLPQQILFQRNLVQHVIVGSTVGHVQQVLESAMEQVRGGEGGEGGSRSVSLCPRLRGVWFKHVVGCESLRRQFRRMSSIPRALRECLIGKSLVHEELCMRNREVAEHMAGKSVCERLPCHLRDAAGHHVDDQSRWRGLIHEHFRKKCVSVDAVDPDVTRKVWQNRVRMAAHGGKTPWT